MPSYNQEALLYFVWEVAPWDLREEGSEISKTSSIIVIYFLILNKRSL